MKKALLIILDGFGVRNNDDFNAVNVAKKPNLTYYMQNYAFGTINASEEYVGLPKGQFGNSEVGHLNLGAGRVVRQDITKIDYEISTGDFYKNPAFGKAFELCQSGNLHLMGLLSDGGVHSHQEHIHQLIKLASSQSTVRQIWLHIFLDGRDTPPQSAERYIRQLEPFISTYSQVKIATMCGRYYAMDRDKRWDRVELAYSAISNGIGIDSFVNPIEGLIASYKEQINDEFVKPLIFNGYNGIQDGDSMIFANFRADRAIQLTDAFIGDQFNAFNCGKFKLGSYVSMTRYSDKFNCLVAYPPVAIKNTLGEYVSNLGFKQLRVAETEKYPHVTYFFNGGEQQPFTNEDRILVDSPKEVATYDLKPEMSLPLVANKLVEAIRSEQYQLIISNFANGDMVGHTGNYEASIKAVEALDRYVGEVVTAMLEHDGEILIVADHGNCEEMFDYDSNQPHTQHTTNVVPCIYIGKKAAIRAGGALEDVAPTILAMMGVKQPEEMSGKNLIQFIN